MNKKIISMAVALAVAASLALTGCNSPAACEDDQLTSSVIDGKSKSHKSKSHSSKRRHSSGYDDDCD